MARRSATESAATLDILRALALVDGEFIAHGRKLLLSVVRMLTTMVKNIEQSPEGRGGGRRKGKE